MFAVHGDLAHVKVVYDRSTGKSMGYGFVKFTTNEAAAAATQAINGMAIERKRIKVGTGILDAAVGTEEDERRGATSFFCLSACRLAYLLLVVATG